MVNQVLAQLSAQNHHYNQTEKKLINFITQQPHLAGELTIRSMADQTGVSTATISRFVKKIGFASYRDFSLALASRTAPNPPVDLFGEIADDDNTQAIANKVFSGAKNALDTTLDQLTANKLDQAAKILLQAQHVGFFGIGGSSIVAFNAYHKFLRTPLNVVSHPDYDIQLMQAVKLTDQDAAIVISHSGRNEDTLLIAQMLKEHGVPTIAITSFFDSPLTHLADLVLLSLAEEVNFRSESMSSLIAQLTIIDTLFTLVGSQLPKETQIVVDNLRQVIEETRQK
ncbi:MurR/RpiR family transcriptional regulator [Convivina intestini]|uniref:RpiR family transcriptional regulator n=1 Tax=Convivina intestini TaxID=1505726 RepID=A0A2U1DCR8_9LACO|nr:MurR/RpiR family transcriptional regulator [Convivina intestini]PVY85372.1 RpiR family transcriptional regulator [Convivina intestini]CAH1853012.1 HTH-type transcriptional regulator HexR [Convivina intestini]SDB85847.1 transcriptional regulator, RpiR family [Leuconostocaceae bacterium R-53105]